MSIAQQPHPKPAMRDYAAAACRPALRGAGTVAGPAVLPHSARHGVLDVAAQLAPAGQAPVHLVRQLWQADAGRTVLDLAAFHHLLHGGRHHRDLRRRLSRWRMFVEKAAAARQALPHRLLPAGRGRLRFGQPAVGVAARTSILGLFSPAAYRLGLTERPRQPAGQHFDTTFWSIIVLVVWKTAGFNMIILLTGLQGISMTEVQEAARIDGASAWQRFRRITLPLMRRTIALALILSVAGSMLAFDQFYIIADGGPQQQHADGGLLDLQPVLRVVPPGLRGRPVDGAAGHPGRSSASCSCGCCAIRKACDGARPLHLACDVSLETAAIMSSACIAAFLFLAPLVWSVLVSFKPSIEARQPPLPPWPIGGHQHAEL